MKFRFPFLCVLVTGLAGCAAPPEQAIKAPEPYSVPSPVETTAKTYAETKDIGSAVPPNEAQPAHTASSPDSGTVAKADKPSPLFKWASTREDGLAEARKKGGFVVLKFEAEWCGPCQVMKREAFHDPKIADTLKKAIIVPIDLDTEMGQKLGMEYQAETIPKLVFLKPDGKAFGVIDGYSSVDWFAGELVRVLKDEAKG